VAIAGDGAAAATAGAILHNEVHPDKPMPVLHEDGRILHDTVSNMGGGMSVKDAFGAAAEKETRIPEAKPAPEARAPEAKPSPAPAESSHHEHEHEHFHVEPPERIHEHPQNDGKTFA
jgi:hypothetical protein